MVELLAVGRVLAALFLVALNGFFVAAEFALVRLRPTSIDRLVEEGHASAHLVEEAAANLDDYLAVCQLGITLASLGLGWIGEPAIAVLVDPLLEPLLPASAVHAVSVGIGFGIVTFLHVVYGELAPKTLAIERAEQVALLVAPPMKMFYYLFVPGIVVFNGIANFSTRLVGVSPASEHDESHTEEEILSILAMAGEAGRVDEAEVEMIERVFDLDDTPVREIMRPRHDVATVSADATLATLRDRITGAEFTRYPVLDTEEQVVGYVDVKDVLQASEAEETTTARDLARDVILVPETTRVDELLETFRDESRQMAVVMDEWGSFEGLVTVEDAVEQIVGDIRDQFDLGEPEDSIDVIEGGGYDVDGGVAVEALADRLNVTIDTEAADTVGGAVLERLGRAPTVGDTVDIDGHTVEVTAVDGARVVSVLVRERE